MKRNLLILITTLALFGCDRGEFGGRSQGEVLSGDAQNEPTNDDNGVNNTGGENNGEPLDGPALEGFQRVSVDSMADATHSIGIAAYQAQAKNQGNIAINAIGLTKTLTIGALGANVETQREIANLLSLAAYDAQAVSDTMKELERDLQSAVEPGMLHLVPSIWAQSTGEFYSEYLDALAYYFGLDVHLVDFRAPDTARLQINNWYRNQTEAYVTDVVTPLEIRADTRIAFVHGSFFSGSWDSPFDRSLSYNGTFHGPNQSTDQRFMVKDDLFLTTETDDYRALIVPYSNSFSFIAISPTESLESVEAKLGDSFFTEILANSEVKSIALTLPITEISGRVNTKKLGLTGVNDADAFDSIASGLGAGAFIQQSILAIDELSTNVDEAPAFDGLGGEELTFDHPFIFAIVDTSTGALIYLGRFNG